MSSNTVEIPHESIARQLEAEADFAYGTVSPGAAERLRSLAMQVRALTAQPAAGAQRASGWTMVTDDPESLPPDDDFIVLIEMAPAGINRPTVTIREAERGKDARADFLAHPDLVRRWRPWPSPLSPPARTQAEACFKTWRQTGLEDRERLPLTEWCDNCRSRHVLHERLRAATRRRGSALRRLDQVGRAAALASAAGGRA